MVRLIVADAHYRQHVTARAQQAEWIDTLRGWIAGVLRGMLQRLDRALDANKPFEAAIGFAVIAAACALAGFGIYVLVRSYLRGAPAPARSLGDAIAGTADLSASALRAAASAAARARRYRHAAALLFASAVRALDERGRIAYDPTRTPGEYRRLVRDPFFDELCGAALVALFAAAEPGDELFERMSGAYDRYFEAHSR